jgi:two-component system phosphate regulon sensor histidine kinase PhoR
MKLEKVVSRPKPGRWILLFILGLAVAGVMATSYNVEIVHHVKLEVPWGKIVFGALGFTGIMGSLVLLFARLLREMRVSQIQADFLDRISHELRTPLATLTLVGDLLKSGGGSQSISEKERLWASHDVELQRLKTDVELLLQAARLRESRLKVDLEKVNVEEWLSSKWGSFRELLGPGSTLALKNESHHLTAFLDLSLFELIVRNLIDNARKFALGTPFVEITLKELPPRMIFSKKRWQLIVRDEGLGFEKGQENKLFKRFSRLKPQNESLSEHSVPGTGLGLYLSASACKAMNLTLVGQSSGEKQGAEFKIEGFLS